VGITNNKVPHNIILQYKKQYRFIHLTLQEIIDNDLISKSDAIKKKNIGVIRNPLDRQLSLYFFLNRTSRNNSPDEFREHFKDGYHFRDVSNHIRQTDYLTIDGIDRGDWWVYENLDTHINEFIEKNTLTLKTGLKNFKSQIRPKDKSIVDKFYDQKTIDAVKKYYEKDFEKYYNLTGIEI